MGGFTLGLFGGKCGGTSLPYNFYFEIKATKECEPHHSVISRPRSIPWRVPMNGFRDQFATPTPAGESTRDSFCVLLVKMSK